MGKLEKIEKLVKKGKTDKLGALARDSDKEVALAAVSGLEKLIETEDGLNSLVGLMEDQDPEIRRAVVNALGASNGSYVETRLSYCIGHDEDAQVVQAAKDALTRIRG